MNARSKAELLCSNKFHSTLPQPSQASSAGQQVKPLIVKTRQHQKEDNPVIRHLDSLQGQLSQQLDSLNTVVESMQRISDIMDRMAKKNCKLNSGAELIDPNRKR